MAKTILVVEDSPTSLALMSYLLEAFGYAVVSAGDGAEGIAKAREHRPDLVLCDINLPTMDGYAVAQAFADDDLLREIPLVAVTALAMLGDRERILASGFRGHIAKPITPETIEVQIARYIAGTGGTPPPPPPPAP